MNLKEKNKALRILKKVYHHTNVDRETKYEGIVGFKTEFLTEEQNYLLERNELVPNSIAKHSHDSLINELLKLQSNKKLTLEFATSLFIKGLTGEVPRFRQTLISYLYLQDVYKHSFQKSETSSGCSICNLPKEKIMDNTHNLYTRYLGHSWNEFPESYASELNDILQYKTPEITEKDKNHLIQLLYSIDKGGESETPGQLEKRIGKEKLLPKTDKYKRYGILQTLAILEILPSKEALYNQPTRSDIVLPLAGWKGELGVNFEKAIDFFNLTMP